MTVTLTATLTAGTHVALDAANSAGTATLFTIERLGDDGYQAVPGGYEATPTSTNHLVVDDWDLPQNTSLTYRAWAKISGNWEVSAPVVVDGTLDRGGDWLYDLDHPEDGMVIYVEDIGDFDYKNVVEVVEPLGRKYPVAAAWGRKALTTAATFLTLDLIARDQFLTIIDGSTLGLAVREPVDFGMPGVLYFVAGEVTEERTSPLGREPSRRWRVPITRVERPVIVGMTSAGSNLWSAQTPNPGETETWSVWTAARESWAAVAG